MLMWFLVRQIKPYIGKKGQNLVEYALLLAIIVAIGYLIFSNNSLKENIQSIFSSAYNVLWEALNNPAIPATSWMK